MNYIAIDNGVSGALAIIQSTGAIKDKIPMPTQKTHRGNEVDVIAVRHFLRNCPPEYHTVVLEEPGGSKSARAASSMAGSFGRLHALSLLMGYKFIRITPQKWQKEMLKCRAKDTKPAAKALCHALWPLHNWFQTPRCTTEFDGFHDACLIGEYSRRHNL